MAVCNSNRPKQKKSGGGVKEREMEKGEYTYAAIHPECGGWKMVIVDIDDIKTEIARELPKCIKAGLKVTRVLTESVRDGSTPMCKCKRGKKR